MSAAREGPGLAALLLLGCALGVASAAHMQQNCKKTLRTLAFERCSGYRDKRSEAAATGLSSVWGSLGTPEGMIEASLARRRQIMSIREIFVSSRVPIYDIPYPPVPSFVRHHKAPIVSSSDSSTYRAARRFVSLPKESSSDLGFDAHVDEMIDLLNEIYERMPRSPTKTKEESMREFMALAYECCKNQDLCLTKKELIPIHCT
ncbi:PREDICTED: uncharacterized protein LOC105365525 [Ceratosolen solmsi marchali]|uniref:Uncharacterized protein LOC105365525 n=1 Tax=Ceratosolen solmsi marchali TaxID=326594 RepID=A0AAJ7DZE1_9HYME|nr:PREDICTED: uncharacterized protein LOC105365525 [Ceratosolen solmsi marchali]